MKTIGRAGSSLATVLAAAVVLALVSTTGAVAGSMITSKRIKNNTIKSIDVKNNNLQGVDIKDRSLSGADIANGSLTGAHIANGSLTKEDFANDQIGVVRGYVLEMTPDRPLQSPHALTGIYGYNSAGGAVLVTRTGVGKYDVTFEGLSLVGGSVLVSSYGETGAVFCRTRGWSGSVAGVDCHNSAGAPTNSGFTLAYTK